MYTVEFTVGTLEQHMGWLAHNYISTADYRIDRLGETVQLLFFDHEHWLLFTHYYPNTKLKKHQGPCSSTG